jgi:pyruvate/2-oxoglutarate dehydrogenase complex dihydrolipoamide dehydrogenase (E3) component
MEHVRAAVEAVEASESPERLAAAGIEVIPGRARFIDPMTIDVDGRAIRARRFVICTGAAPVEPSIPGLAGVPRLTHRTIFDLDRPPGSLLVLGGGPVGVELAQALARLGSEVTVVERAGRLLPAADPEASAPLAAAFQAEGIRVLLGAALERVESRPGGVAATVSGQRLEADALLVATGRRPVTDGLDLERAGVEVTPAGITVNSRLRTTRRGIYAAGDVTGGPQFTHYAAWQGFAAARNALFPGSARGLRDPVPWAVFTDPEVAQAGLTEAEARDRPGAVQVHRLPWDRVDRARTDADTAGFLKLVARGDRVLGATVVGAGAADVANQLAVAIEAGIRLSKLSRTILIYPTRGFGVLQLASEIALNRAARSLLLIGRRPGGGPPE